VNAEVMHAPAPGVGAALGLPIARSFARRSNANPDTAKEDLAALPGKLDRVDSLIEEGVIGGAEPNAADFQIGTTVRVLLSFEDLRQLVEGRPAADLAMRLLPEVPGPVPSFVPPDWLTARGGATPASAAP
jgi:glutathione S-transferase